MNPKKRQKASKLLPLMKELINEVNSTLPLGVEVSRILRFRIPLERSYLDFIVIRCFIPQNKESKIQEWRDSFRQKTGVLAILDRMNAESGLKKELSRWGDKARLLTDEHLPRVRGALKQLYGEPPPQNNLPPLPVNKEPVKDFYVAIDNSSVKDREDVVSATKRDGCIELKVGFIDVTWFVKPESPYDLYASRIGETRYGSRGSIPTLGPFISEKEASFVLNQNRLAWIVKISIDDRGRIVGSSVSYENIICNSYISPEELAERQEEGTLDQSLNSLIEAASRLRRSRLKSKKVVRIEGDGVAEKVIAESMIAAKRTIAEYCIQKNLPIIFRVHAKPSTQTIERFVERLVDIKINVTSEDFEHPEKLIQILESLENLNKPRLLHEIINSFLVKSSFDVNNRGHFGLGIDSELGEGYLEIKPREYVGLVNQFQLRASILKDLIPLTYEEVRSKAEKRNRQIQADPFINYRYRFLERLEHYLNRVGEKFEGKIVRIRSDWFSIEVEGFSKWGLVKRSGEKSRLKFKINQKLKVELKGFNKTKMRFEFYPLEEKTELEEQ